LNDWTVAPSPTRPGLPFSIPRSDAIARLIAASIFLLAVDFTKRKPPRRFSGNAIQNVLAQLDKIILDVADLDLLGFGRSPYAGTMVELFAIGTVDR
jgi:hypothetical protein